MSYKLHSFPLRSLSLSVPFPSSFPFPLRSLSLLSLFPFPLVPFPSSFPFPLRSLSLFVPFSVFSVDCSFPQTLFWGVVFFPFDLGRVHSYTEGFATVRNRVPKALS